MSLKFEIKCKCRNVTNNAAVPRRRTLHSVSMDRRMALGGIASGILVLCGLPVKANPPLTTNREVDNESSPWIQEMLRKTAEKKSERYKERLDDYYKRNFGDYLSFELGMRDGVSMETKAAIRAWLEKNKD